MANTGLQAEFKQNKGTEHLAYLELRSLTGSILESGLELGLELGRSCAL